MHHVWIEVPPKLKNRPRCRLGLWTQIWADATIIRDLESPSQGLRRGNFGGFWKHRMSWCCGKFTYQSDWNKRLGRLMLGFAMYFLVWISENWVVCCYSSGDRRGGLLPYAVQLCCSQCQRVVVQWQRNYCNHQQGIRHVVERSAQWHGMYNYVVRQ